jgi:predicted histone-like DNA-binding protein
MAKYRIYQNKNEKSNGFGKYYAKAKLQGMVNNEELAKRLASRNTGFSEGNMRGILIDLAEIVRELSYDGKSVKIDNLGIFWLGMKSKGAASPDKFEPTSMIKSHFRCRATGSGKSKALATTRANGVQLVWQEDDNYTSPRSKNSASGATVQEG